MNEEVFYETAIKILTGKSSEEEKELLRQYLLYPEYKVQYNKLAETFKNHPAEVYQEFDLKRGLKKLRRKIEQTEPARTSFTNKKAWAFAASLVLFLGLGMLVKRHFFTSKPINYVSVTSKVGQRTEILLPDSSIVYLNSGTSIRYPEKFVGNYRNIELKGEAFFKVKRNIEKPFVVNSGHFKTTVLGTSFNVVNNGDNDFRVVVKTGKVKVENQVTQRQFTLVKNTQVVFNAATGKLEKSYTNAEHITDWHKNLLRFDAITAKEAFAKIEKWYNVKIHCKSDSILNRKIRAAYRNESIDKVLKSLEFMIGLKYEIKNDSVTIK